MKANDGLHEAAEIKATAVQKSKKFIQSYFAWIALAVNILISVTARLYDGGFRNPFTADFFISLFTNIMTTMFCYIAFTEYGEMIEKESSTAYKANCEKWADLSERVRTGLHSVFRAYCLEQVEVERADKKREIIENYTMISFSTYREEYEKKSSKELHALYKAGKLSKTELLAIIRANRVRVAPINPVVILCGVAKSNFNDAGRDGMKSSTRAILFRPFFMLILNAAISSMWGKYVGISSVDKIYEIILSILLILWASFIGYMSGASSAKNEHGKVKARILFLQVFINKGVENNGR